MQRVRNLNVQSYRLRLLFVDSTPVDPISPPQKYTIDTLMVEASGIAPESSLPSTSTTLYIISYFYMFVKL